MVRVELGLRGVLEWVGGGVGDAGVDVSRGGGEGVLVVSMVGGVV